MGLLAAFDEPVLGDLSRARRTRRWSVSRLPPLLPGTGARPHDHEEEDEEKATTTVARFLVEALLVDARTVRDLVPELEASVDERVVVWSPTLQTTSRTELVTALLESDDAIADLHVETVAECVAGSNAWVEWRVTGRFDNAAFVNDDLLIEPSGGTIESAGVSVFSFTGLRAVRIHCFYDRLALLEQVLPGGTL